ncbi:unnamed protein product (macronuclear) [Paramecium tetraurelia]|uniref:TNFR-Cys domain-containing protein n=1 Tax=Paramecium tetraurelia TaxID=5888 RepID=A0C533_PARTE|nr:uncharacterized protein GSPATT00006399001 [Paramecium tetraurelia]CAK65900.1 unnamed protein product [Paramecium tetraurelia]|eukprot:XP_001433297.1 hypothetical protein (macronuclear) [Paramecium tetraurelia strain d4-2]
MNLLLFITLIKSCYNQAVNTYVKIGCVEIVNGNCVKLCKLGLFDCDDYQNLICEYGYFNYESTCVQCPKQNLNDDSVIYCGDCIDNSKTWQNSRLCTYDFIIEDDDRLNGAYIKRINEYSELYVIGVATTQLMWNKPIARDTTRQYESQICSGCHTICTSTSDPFCNTISNEVDQLVKGITCLDGYFFQNGVCVACGINCIECKDRYTCVECYSGYYLNGLVCDKCQSNCLDCLKPITEATIKCYSCLSPNIISIDRSVCESCGDSCLRCEYVSYDQITKYKFITRDNVDPAIDDINRYVKRCRQCDGNNLVDYRGQDCVQCQIKDCLKCYYTITMGGVSRSTLDLDFQPLKPSEQASQQLCYLCASGTSLSPDMTQCMPQAPTTPVVDCLYYGDSSNKCQQCQNYQILDFDNNLCKSDFCFTQIKNCQNCYQYRTINIVQQKTFYHCTKCEEYYYPDFFTGTCEHCPNHCSSCWQYSQTYNFTLYNEIPKIIQNRKIYYLDGAINIYCSECESGFQLYNNQCLGCTSNCMIPATGVATLKSSCLYKSKYALCSQCYEPLYQRSLTSDLSECQECPNYCLACHERLKSQFPNKYFNPSSQILQKYSRSCYKLQTVSGGSAVIHYNSQLNMPVSCNTDQPCRYKYDIDLILFCSVEDYLSQLTFSPSNAKFYYNLATSYTTKSEDVATIKFANLETLVFYEYLNTLPLEILNLNLKIKGDSNNNCNFSKSTRILTQFHENVFSLIDFKFTIMSYSSDPLNLYVNGNFTLSNYPNIIIQNIRLYTQESQFIFKLDECSNLFLSSVQFQKVSSTALQILLQNLDKLDMQDVTFDNFTGTNDIISFSPIKQIVMQNVVFNSLKLKSIYLIEMHPQVDIKMNNIKISNSVFVDFHFIGDLEPNDQLIGKTIIIGLEIINNTFNSSFIFKTSNSEKFFLSQLSFKDNLIYDSELFISNHFIFSNALIYNNQFGVGASLLGTSDEIFEEQLYTLSESNFTDVQIVNNSCYQSLIQIQSPFNQQYIVMNIKIDSLYVDQIETSKDGTPLIQIKEVGYIQINNLIIKNLLKVTGLEIKQATWVWINQFECDSANQNTQMPIQESCFEQKEANSYCLHIEEFDRGVYLQNGIIKKQLQMDSSLIYIKSFDYLTKNTESNVELDNSKFFFGYSNELVKLEDIKFYNNTLAILDPQIKISSIVIDSTQRQKVLISDLTFVGNHLHRIPPSVNVDLVTCILIDSPLADLIITNSEFLDNRATKSILGLNKFIVDSVILDSLNMQDTNVIQIYYADILEEHSLFTQDPKVEIQNIQSYFEIQSLGSNIYFDCDNISISNLTINNSVGLDGAGMFIVGSEKLVVKMSDIVMKNLVCSLEYDTLGCGMYINTQVSSLSLEIQDMTMDKIIAYQGAGIYILSQQFLIQVSIRDSIFHQCQSLDSQVFYFKQQTFTTSIPSILFDNCTVYNNHYDNYLLNIITLRPQIDYDARVEDENQLISIDYATITITNCLFTDISFTTILKLQNIIQLTILNTNINNVAIGLSKLINLEFYNQVGHISISGLIIQNVYPYPQWDQQQMDYLKSKYSDQLESSTVAEQVDQLQECKLPKTSGFVVNLATISYDIDTSKIPRNPVQYSKFNTTLYTYYTNYEDTSLITYLYSEYIINNLINSYPALIYLPDVDFISTDASTLSHSLQINKLLLKSITCGYCTYGLFYIQNINTKANKSIVLNEVNCVNNVVDQYGCINLKGRTTSDLKNTKIYTIIVENSNFMNNQAVYGAGLSVQNVSLYLKNTSFLDNTATKTGGAILFSQSNKQIYLEEVTIQGNKADIGGGIYMNGQSLPGQDVNIIGNTGRSLVEEIPQHLSISMIKGAILPTKVFDTNIDALSLTLNLPSGQSISSYKLYYQPTQEQVPYDWIFRVMNLDRNHNPILTASLTDTCNITGRMQNSENFDKTLKFLSNYTQPSLIYFSDESFNLDELIITFDPYLPEQYYLQLQFQCSTIKLPIEPYPYQSYSTNYALYVNLRTLPCQLGEAYTAQKCQVCGKGQYALTINQVICTNMDVQSMEEVTPVRIKLFSGYWRYDNDRVENCYNLEENCNGGWIPGNPSCYSGHTGALCESCDIYGIRGEQYSISTKYKCGQCSQTKSNNSLTIAAICIFTLLQMVLSVRGNFQMIENFIKEQVLQSIGVRMNVTQANLSILIKIIISALGTFRISIPTNLISSVDIVANPTQSMAYSLDCFLIEITITEILYFRMIWALVMPLIYLLIFFMGYFLGVITTFLPARMNIIYTTFIYMFIYLQPTLIGGFIALLSSRTLGGVDFVQSDVQYLYDSSTHYFWMVIFAAPNIFCWGALFPYIFMHLIRRNNQTLTSIQTRRKYGYFYNEYTQHAYLWEFVKIFEKQFVLMALTYYEDTVIIKGLMVFLIVFIYGILSFEFQPYQSKRLNYIDQMSAAVCVFSLCLGVLIKASQSENMEYLQFIMFSIIGVLNLLFLLILLFEVFRGYIDKFEIHIDKIRDKIRQKYPQFQNYKWIRQLLINRGELKKRIKILWSHLRYQTHRGIMRRRQDKNLPLFEVKLILQDSEKDIDHSRAESRVESKANSRLSVIDINQEELMQLANYSSLQAKTPEIQKIYPLESQKSIAQLTKKRI